MKKYFYDKVFIITGASSGIGKAISLEAAKQGANVVIAARNINKLNDVVKVIQGFKVQSLAVKTDVSKIEEVQNLINKTVEKFGKIDVLVNNAGVSMRAMFDELPLHVFDKIMNINFKGTVYCSRFALPYILKEKGSIVGVSSISGFTPLPARSAYCASKYAMNGFLETLRIENLKRNLHVLISHPGFTESEIRKKAFNKDGVQQESALNKEHKMITAEDVAVKIIRGIKKRRKTQIMTRNGKIVWFFNKFFPFWTHKQLYKEVNKEPDSPLPK